MYTTHAILKAAATKFGRPFKTVREIEIYLKSLESEGEEISQHELMKLGIACGLPMNYAEIATCDDDTLLQELEQHRVRLMQQRTARNTLYIEQKPRECIVEQYVDGKLVNRTTTKG